MASPAVQFTEHEKMEAWIWEIHAAPTSKQQEARIIAEDRIPRGFEIIRKCRAKAAKANPKPKEPTPKLPYWTASRVNDCLASAQLLDVQSLDFMVDFDEPGGRSRLDFIADPSSEINDPANHESLEPILRAIEELSERERFVVRSKVIDGDSLVDIASLLAEIEGGRPMSRERIRQIYENGLFNIRKAIGIVGRAA